MEDGFLGLGPHWEFILASYVTVAVVLVGLLAWVLLDERQLRRTLKRFEREGLTRRRARAQAGTQGEASARPTHSLTQATAQNAPDSETK